jgi:hypothetical protein
LIIDFSKWIQADTRKPDAVSALIVMLLRYEKRMLNNNTDNKYKYNKAAAFVLSGC